MKSRRRLGQLLLPGILMLAAAGATIDTLDRTGQVVIREGPTGDLDLFKGDGTRAGYGIRRSDGSTDLFRPDGSRLGHIQPSRSPEGPATGRIILSPRRR